MIFPLGQAAETDQALPVSPARIYPLGQAAETDSAQTIHDQITVFQANETDSVPAAFTSVKTKTVNRADETDSAFPLTAGTGFTASTIAAPALIGPYIEEGTILDEIFAETIPGMGVATGPLWIADDDSSPFVSTLRVELLDTDGVTVISGDPLAKAFNVSWLDELNGPGYGSLDIPMSETAAIAELTQHRLVRCYVGGVEAFCWQIEAQPQIISVAEDEDHGQIMQVRGRGWAAVLDDAIVYPMIPYGETKPDLTSPFLGPDRVFSFASPDYPGPLPGVWGGVQSFYRWETLQPFRHERVETYEGVWETLPSPVGLPWPNAEVYPNILDPSENSAHWIWPTTDPSQQGWAFFIGDLLYPDTHRPITFTVTADNLFTFFIDGTPLLGERLDTSVWKGWKEFSTTILTYRWYRVACVVQNTPGPPPNPGGFLMAATYANEAGVIEDWAMTTNNRWVGTYSPDVWPGWTAGQILLKLVSEANTRRAGSPELPLDYDFTEMRGSDNLPWTVRVDGQATTKIPWFSVSHGSTYLEALDQLHQDGWVNWRMQCGGLVLQMWSFDSPPLDTLIEYTVGTNITSLERSGNQKYANVLLVSYEGGYVEVRDDASVALYGHHEDVLSSDATDRAEAQRIGGHEIAQRARDSEGGAIVMEIEPVDDSDTPYLAYLPGAGVYIPSLQGGSALVQVLSISVRQDDMGDPKFILELNKRWPVQERDTSRLLRSIGGKSLGSAGTRGKVT